MKPPQRRVWVGLSVAALALLAGCEPGSVISLAPSGSPAFRASSQSASAPAFKPGVVPAEADKLADQVLTAVNAERQKAGLKPLIPNDTLARIGDDYANRLIMGDFFAHTDPLINSTVATRARDRQYLFYKVGENLAAGQQDVAAAMKDWMDSPSHRANILDPDFTEIGIAIRDGGRHGRYWVQEFGRLLGE